MSGPSREERWTALAFIAPGTLTFVCVLVAPLLYSIGLSAFDTTITTLVQGGDRFVGLGNYRELLGDGAFASSLARLCVFTALTTAVEVGLALAVAVYLDQVCRLPRPLEAALLLPMFVIPVVAGLVFRYLLDPGEGLIAAVFGWFGAPAPGMLGDPDLALVAVMLMDVWRMWPFVFLIVYAGVKSLPREPIEAVRLDGATTWQTLRFVILPMLRSTLVVAVVLKVIESLKAFTEIYVMTGGGPGEATSLLSLFVVKQAFEFFRLGYGAAASTVVFVLGVVAATLLLWTQNRRRGAEAGE